MSNDTVIRRPSPSEMKGEPHQHVKEFVYDTDDSTRYTSLDTRLEALGFNLSLSDCYRAPGPLIFSPCPLVLSRGTFASARKG